MTTTRREMLQGVAVLAATEKLTDGGFAPVSLPGCPDRGATLLPPGAVRRADFRQACIGCGACVMECPGKCLRPSTSLAGFGQPEMDFRRGYCRLSCVKCAETCPVGAIRRFCPDQRPYVHIGHAEWKKDLCVRTTNGDPCTACVRKCPVQAIHLVQGFPVVDRETCIGCGACEHVCPARPQPAIYVKGSDMQRIVSPMSEADLVAEMKALVDGGKALVTAKDGVIALVLEGRGLNPIADALEKDAKAFDGAIVWDKIVGRAAAAYYVKAGAAKVFARVMSEDARVYLKTHGVFAQAETCVAKIINREGTDECPMEKAVRDLTDPEQMIKAIGKAMKR